jgi:hypothetical protein
LLKLLANFVFVAGVLVVNVAIAAPPQVTVEVRTPRGEISHPPYMVLVGRASSHIFLVVPENQSENPWKLYPVTQGFKPEDSCVTTSWRSGQDTSLCNKKSDLRISV